jgi:hypothetical protein
MSITTEPTAVREPGLRDAAATLARAAARQIEKLRAELRERRVERDLDEMVDRLEQLNDRQLAALGLNRSGLYAQVEARLDALRGEDGARGSSWAA